MEKKEIAIVAGVVAAAVIITAVLVTVYWRIHATGHIKTVGIEIYDGPALTNKVASVDWGILTPGGSGKVDLWIQNTGNSPVNLTLSTEKWVPSQAQGYMTLSWNYTQGRILQPLEVIHVGLVLTVSPSILGITDFSFDIIVTASG